MNLKEQQFAQVVKDNRSTIYVVCYMFSNDAEEVADLFQEVLVKLWNGYDSFQGKSDIKTWIYRVTLNTCITIYVENYFFIGIIKNYLIYFL